MLPWVVWNLKFPKEDLELHFSQVRVQSYRDRQVENKATKEQETITATDQELRAIKSRNEKWAKKQDQRPGTGYKGSRYTSNFQYYIVGVIIY